MLKEAGIISGTALSETSLADFKELKKNDLKGTHLGQTEEKLQQIFDDYQGGVLFFDEAYTYTTKDEYEKSILDDLLVKKTEETTCEDRIIFIFAGLRAPPAFRSHECVAPYHVPISHFAR